MLQRIEYARRQAVDAYARAAVSIDTRLREEWLKAARMWEQIAHHYEYLLKISGTEPDQGG